MKLQIRQLESTICELSFESWTCRLLLTARALTSFNDSLSIGYHCVAFDTCNMYCIYTSSVLFNPLKTKRRLLYLKTQFVPRSKHFSSPL